NALPERAQRTLRRMLDRLVDLLLFKEAITLAEPVSGNPEFRAWFESLGPRDASGRSLRELDLDTRLFRHPVSYLAQSRELAALPAFARDYVQRELTAVLQGEKPHAALVAVSAEARLAALALLQQTGVDP
ncbi:MAG: hypothetical protein ACO3PV_08140, partial [Pseudohongiellaceae bacterium]